MSTSLTAGHGSSDRTSVGRPQVLERGEVAGRLAAGQPPGPLTADRLGETELQDRVERRVGSIEYDAEEPVELRRRHRVQRQAPDQVDVSGPVDGERHAGEPGVALEQPPMYLRVVLVRVACHEGIHDQAVLSHGEAARRLELAFAGELDREPPWGALLPPGVHPGEMLTDGLRRLRDCRARAAVRHAPAPTSPVRSAART